MLRIDFQTDDTRRLHDALSTAYSTKDSIVALLQRTTYPPARYPDKETVALSWQYLLFNLQSALRLEELLNAVLQDAGAAAIYPVVRNFLNRSSRTSELRMSDRAPEACVQLLRKTLCRHLGEEAEAIARNLVDRLTADTDASGIELFEATRFAVEYHLLTADDLSPTRIFDVAQGKDGQALADFRARLHSGLEARELRRITVPVTHRGFFSRTLERKDEWSAYFETVRALTTPDSPIGTSLCRITTSGFLAPQFLIAGLLARFEDNWGPIITEYEHEIKDEESAFVSFQASQWRTWLMWGPSIPICQCTEWQGVHALQYGYGDENNSIPIIAASGGVPVLDGLANAYDPRDPLVGAVFRPMTGRLRWAPWLLYQPSRNDVPKGSGEIPLRPVTRYLAARAQRMIYATAEEDQPPSPPEALLFQVEKMGDSSGAEQSYFSGYLWLMFLIGRKPAQPGRAPQRLVDIYPSPGARFTERSPRHLWRDLLPIYVHANLADAKALGMHRHTLVHNAICLLRQIWSDRRTLFAELAETELCFCLVGGSDYSGCGHQIRFPSGDPLVDGLRACVAEMERSDPDFARSILLPAVDETASTRPPELAEFYSTCHLPDLVNDYYRYLVSLQLA